MMHRARGRWIATVMVTLTMLIGLEATAFAYPQAPHVPTSARLAALAAMASPATSRVVAPVAHLARGPHLLARQANRYRAGIPAPPVTLDLSASAANERQHLIAGTVLTIAASVLLANFLWMVIVGAIWFFAYYLPEAGSDSVFPPQAALFFISFAFLVPGVILLPMGLGELKTYRAIESAELGPTRYPGLGRTIACHRGGIPLVRF